MNISYSWFIHGTMLKLWLQHVMRRVRTPRTCKSGGLTRASPQRLLTGWLPVESREMALTVRLPVLCPADSRYADRAVHAREERCNPYVLGKSITVITSLLDAAPPERNLLGLLIGPTLLRGGSNPGVTYMAHARTTQHLDC